MNLQCSTEDQLYSKISTEVTVFREGLAQNVFFEVPEYGLGRIVPSGAGELKFLKSSGLGQSSVLLYLVWRKIHTLFSFNKG